MQKQRTFSIIKPDATKRNLVGVICKKLEDSGLRIIAQKRIKMTKEQAEGFYSVHKNRPFYRELCDFMIWNCGNLEQLNKQIEYFMLWLKAKI